MNRVRDIEMLDRCAVLNLIGVPLKPVDRSDATRSRLLKKRGLLEGDGRSGYWLTVAGEIVLRMEA